MPYYPGTATHVPIEFDDGIRWIARIGKSRSNSGLALDLSRKAMESELATMLRLREAGLPVAKVVSPMYTHGELDYFIMEMLLGQACKSPIWINDIPKSNTSKTIADYAALNILRADSSKALRLHGSLQYNPTAVEKWSVGPLSCSSNWSAKPPHRPGPFRTASEKWGDTCQFPIDAIQAGKAYIDDREQAFLTYRWMQDAVSEYGRYKVEEETYIVHEDSNGGHIMVDDEGNITGLIDWEMTSVGSKWEAFAAPMALWDTELYFRGSNDLSFGEKELYDDYVKLGRQDLADCVKEGKVYQRLWWLMFSEIRELFDYRQIRGLGEAFGLVMPETKEEFLATQKVKYGHELAPLLPVHV